MREPEGVGLARSEIVDDIEHAAPGDGIARRIMGPGGIGARAGAEAEHTIFLAAELVAGRSLRTVAAEGAHRHLGVALSQQQIASGAVKHAAMLVLDPAAAVEP